MPCNAYDRCFCEYGRAAVLDQCQLQAVPVIHPCDPCVKEIDVLHVSAQLMPHAPRSIWGLRRKPELPAAVPHVAPDRLRQRVLGSVKGERDPCSGGHAGQSRRAWAVLGGSIVIFASLLATGLLAPERSAPRSSAQTLSAATTHAHLRRAGPRAELIVSGMPQPPVGEVYEVWLNHAGGAPQPTDALFTVTSEGDAAVEVPGDLRGVREVTVTSEPLGGSSSPTTAPVLRVPLVQHH
jgi:hypothetical protein